MGINVEVIVGSTKAEHQEIHKRKGTTTKSGIKIIQTPIAGWVVMYKQIPQSLFSRLRNSKSIPFVVTARI